MHSRSSVGSGAAWCHHDASTGRWCILDDDKRGRDGLAGSEAVDGHDCYAQLVAALGLLSWESVAHFVGVDVAVDRPDEIVKRQVAILIKPAARCGEEVIECLGAHWNNGDPVDAWGRVLDGDVCDSGRSFYLRRLASPRHASTPRFCVMPASIPGVMAPSTTSSSRYHW